MREADRSSTNLLPQVQTNIRNNRDLKVNSNNDRLKFTIACFYLSCVRVLQGIFAARPYVAAKAGLFLFQRPRDAAVTQVHIKIKLL